MSLFRKRFRRASSGPDDANRDVGTLSAEEMQDLESTDYDPNEDDGLIQGNVSSE